MRILPFAAYPEPTISYPEALELATVLLTVESRRGKGTGFILRKATEEVRWVSRVVWPMLALPVTLPEVRTAQDGEPGAAGYEPSPRKLLFFDLTGLTSGAMPPFQAREGLDLPVAEPDRPPVGDFITLLRQKTQAMKEPRKPLWGAITGLIRRGDAEAEVEGFISGQRQLAQDLVRHLAEMEAPDWTGVQLPRKLSAQEAVAVAHELEERLRAYLAQADRIEQLAGDLAVRAEGYPAELAETRERVEATYNAQIEAIRPDVERGIAEHQRALEDKLNSVNMQYSGTLAALEAEVSRAEHDEDRFRSLGKEYEGQLADARRNRQNAQRRLDQTARERDAGARQARDHFRSLIDQENERLNALIKGRDREVQALNATEQQLRQALGDMAAAGAAAAQKDRESAAELAAQALEAPDTDTSGPLEFGLPGYVARLDGQRTRYLVLSPLTLKRAKSVGQFVSGLIGGLALPAEPRSSLYEQIFARSLAAALEGAGPVDASAATVAAVVTGGAPSADVLADSDFKQLALEGLERLKEDNWLRGKQYDEQRTALEKLFK